MKKPRICYYFLSLLVGIAITQQHHAQHPVKKKSVCFRSYRITSQSPDVRLEWQLQEKLNRIEVWRATGSDALFAKYGILAGNATAYADHYPAPDTENSYELKGLDKSGKVLCESFSLSAYVAFEPVLKPVESLEVSDHDRGLKLKWNYAQERGIAKFKIYLAKGKDLRDAKIEDMKFDEVPTDAGFKTNFVYETELGGWFNFYVRAVAASGTEGPIGPVVSIFKEEKGAPSPLYGFRASYNPESRSVRMQWKIPPDLRIKNFRLHKDYSKKREALQRLSVLMTVPISDSAEDKEVRPGMWYTYGIVARNVSGGFFSSTPESSMVYAEPVYVPFPIPPAVEALTYTKEDDLVRLRWESENIADDVRYTIYAKEKKEKDFKIIAEKLEKREFKFEANPYPQGTILFLYVVPINGDGVRGNKGKTIIVTL